MGTTALSLRLPRRLAKPGPTSAVRCGLAFDEVDGPVIVLCGIVGGSGATTLAVHLAGQAARESRAPVLLTELGTGGGISALVGERTPVGFMELAGRIARDEAPEVAYASPIENLRLIASESDQPCSDVDARDLLDDARAEHGLTVVDCGAAQTPPAWLLAATDLLVWTTSASPVGLERARTRLAPERSLGQPREVLVASTLQPTTRVKARDLRRAAEHRCDRLVLVPHEPTLGRWRASHTSQVIARALTALSPTVRRRP